MAAEQAPTGYLAGVRVLEVADEIGEYCGKLLAGLGADVVKVEPPGGEVTRTYGPFYGDVPDPARSLHFWHYNLGKRGVVLDLDSPEGRSAFAELAAHADVVIDGRPRHHMADRGLGHHDLSAAHPELIYLRLTHFGDDGPWADHRGSDLVHLALGGVMMNCGYDPDETGHHRTPPIAPQMWQSFQIAGEMATMAVLGALHHRSRHGVGQYLETNVHQAVSQSTETDLPDWLFLRQAHLRQTARHSMPAVSAPWLATTRDGRHLMPYRTYLRGGAEAWTGTLELLEEHGVAAEQVGLQPAAPAAARTDPAAQRRLATAVDQLVASLPFSADLWRDAQAHGLTWAPVRRPEENVGDEHWRARGAFVEVLHPELGRSFTYTGAKWVADGVPWRHGPRAPLLGEHTAEVLMGWAGAGDPERTRDPAPVPEPRPSPRSRHEGPAALADVRVVDLSWMLASAGAGRFLSAMGAEVIKVEHESRWDAMRFGRGACPPGGRPARMQAHGPMPTPADAGPDRSGAFMEINSGKLGISLNLKNTEGRRLLEELITGADIVVEGFSPGTMDRMGLGYRRLRELNPTIIYVQQSGFGQRGTYGQMRAYGPTVQAITGITEMSGLPDPHPPAGIGYSYLDWVGAYNMANAVLAALCRRDATGQGCHIDASQGEAGLYFTGTAILDHTVNGRRWSRYGNRSPFTPAAPHGAYRTAGDDRWIAITVFDDEQWLSLARTLGRPGWERDPRFADVDARLAHQDELDDLVSRETAAWDGFELMAALQSRGVPAGVCQTAQDRYESDPQLRHLRWTVELDQRDIGRWPVREFPTRMSLTPAYAGGRFARSGPSYGQDTEDVLSTILGRSPADIARLRQAGAL